MKNLAVEENLVRVSENVEALSVTSGFLFLSKAQENKKRVICVRIWRLVSTELDQADSYALYGACLYMHSALNEVEEIIKWDLTKGLLVYQKEDLVLNIQKHAVYLTSTVILLSSKCALISMGSPFA